MVLVAQGPIQAHFKICAVQRPSSQVDFLGDITPQGVLRPGLLHLLRLLVLDRFLAALKAGSLDSFPKTIVFFRGSEAMGLILLGPGVVSCTGRQNHGGHWGLA